MHLATSLQGEEMLGILECEYAGLALALHFLDILPIFSGPSDTGTDFDYTKNPKRIKNFPEEIHTNIIIGYRSF